MIFWWFMFVCNMLIPATMVIGGYMMWKHCPSEPNDFLGYRTKRSMKNMDTWKFAHDYCGRQFWKTGWILIIPTVLIQLPFIRSSTDKIGIFSLIIIFIQAVVLFFPIVLTESALKKNFDKNEERR